MSNQDTVVTAMNRRELA